MVMKNTDHLDHQGFNDLHKPLSLQQAIAESDRCLYCYDAPCIQACPTSIDIPTFIHQIRTENILGSATTILSQNIMGGTCARACPTEVLCEQVCVLNTSTDQPVEIGLLQRYAVDHLIMSNTTHPFHRKASTGKKVAIVGAGPAGLSCAHRLAMLGHQIDVYEAKSKSGGLNEYGLAAYKMINNFAQKEVQFLLEIGGIDIHHEQKLGEDISLEQLSQSHDATFIGIGLSEVHQLGIANESFNNVMNAVDFIENIRQTADKSSISMPDDVVVIGAGNTAIDAAIQAKKLGATNVTMVYRRDQQHMSATPYEVDLARKNGVIIKLWSSPTTILGIDDVKAIQFNITTIKDGKLVISDQDYTLKADMVLKAIGQKLNTEHLNGIDINRGKITVTQDHRTSMAGVFAGGDAINSGEDLTVQAVEDGKQAAHSIDLFLKREHK